MHKNRVGLGTFPLAGVFSRVSKEETKDIVRLFLKDGGYYIDTAPMYGMGEVELLLGEVIGEFKRDDFYLVTKCGYVVKNGKITKSSKYKDIIEECERSLKRLKLDYFDLYLEHSPDPNVHPSEVMKALKKLQKDGKVKQIGVSNVSLEELQAYSKYGKVDNVQNRFSLINRSINECFSEYLIKNDIKLTPYQTIERGMLTHKAILGISLRNGDLRRTKPEWQKEKREVITDWVKDKFYPLAKKVNVDIENLIIAYTLSRSYVSFPIVGATNTEQVLINLKSDKVKLSKEIINSIEILYKDFEEYIKNLYGQEPYEFMGLTDKFYHPSGAELIK